MCTLIRHENEDQSTGRRNLKTPASRFNMDGLKTLTDVTCDNPDITLPESKMSVDCSVSNSSNVMWTALS